MNHQLLGAQWAVQWVRENPVFRAQYGFGHNLGVANARIVHGGRVIATVSPGRDARDIAKLIANGPAMGLALVEARGRLRKASHPNAIALLRIVEAALDDPEESGWE